jgi:hypothetical protein
MWAQYVSYRDGNDQPRQVFLTKNAVLCNEVKRSFNNMGLAWRKKFRSPKTTVIKENKNTAIEPRFLTSTEWLDILDLELPGEPFFSPPEREQRNENRKEKDTVTSGVEALLSEDRDTFVTLGEARQQMDFAYFRKLWRKIKSGSGSQLDAVLVWREIQS